MKYITDYLEKTMKKIKALGIGLLFTTVTIVISIVMISSAVAWYGFVYSLLTGAV